MTNKVETLLKTVRHNSGMKMLSLLLAVICWLLIRREISFPRTVTGVPVEIIPPKNYVLHDPESPTAKVLVSGSQGDIDSLMAGDLKIKIDMTDWRAVTNNFIRLQTKYVHAPSGINVERVEPSLLHIQMMPVVVRPPPGTKDEPVNHDALPARTEPR